MTEIHLGDIIGKCRECGEEMYVVGFIGKTSVELYCPPCGKKIIVGGKRATVKENRKV